MALPEGVRRLALDPFGELPVPKEVERVDVGGAVVSIFPWPTAQIVRPVGVTPSGVAAAVEASRVLARERGKQTLAWWVTSEHGGLTAALEEAGLVNTDTPGFEAIENGMALTSPPARRPAENVEIAKVETWEDFAAVAEVGRAVFEMPEVPEEELRQRYADYVDNSHLGVSLSASIDDRIVGGAYTAFGTAGVNLFGASVAPEARGRGVYGSLVLGRWDLAVERGTPALTVQAGRMSRPLCEKMGFAFVEAVHLYVDELPDD